MNLVESAIPVIFINPVTGKPDQMPVEMIAAYVPDSSMLNLEQAAKIASTRDFDAAQNLLLSVQDATVLSSLAHWVGAENILTIEPPSLR